MSHVVSVASTHFDPVSGAVSVVFAFDGVEVAADIDEAGRLVFASRPQSLGADEDATEDVVQAGLALIPPLQFSLVTFPPPDPEPSAPTAAAFVPSALAEPPSALVTPGDASKVVKLGQSHEEVVLATVGFAPPPFEGDPPPVEPVATVGADVKPPATVLPPHVAEALAPYMPGAVFTPDPEPSAPDESAALEQLSRATGLSVEQLRAAVDAAKPARQNPGESK